jgi:hypothetical protein
LIPVDRHDAGAVRGKESSAGAANAAARAGHDGALVAQAAVRCWGCLNVHAIRAAQTPVHPRTPEERVLPQTP